MGDALLTVTVCRLSALTSFPEPLRLQNLPHLRGHLQAFLPRETEAGEDLGKVLSAVELHEITALRKGLLLSVDAVDILRGIVVIMTGVQDGLHRQAVKPRVTVSTGTTRGGRCRASMILSGL